MQEQKTVTLLRRLFDRTNDGELGWEEAGDADGFRADLSGYQVLILRREVRDQFGNPNKTYILSILNPDGRLIEEITPEDFGTSLPNPERVMESLYEGARRRAMGVEEAFESILSSLEAPSAGRIRSVAMGPAITPAANPEYPLSSPVPLPPRAAARR